MKHIMKAFIASAVLAAFTLPSVAASKAATEAWVANYFYEMGGGTNDVYDIGIGGGRFKMWYEAYDRKAVAVTNSTVATITNGTYFAYVDDGIYTNAILGTSIQATKTNMVYNGIHSSTNSSGITMFGDSFGVVGARMTTRGATAIGGK